MLKNYKRWLKAAMFALLLGCAPQLLAQAVIFPQEKQPGVAQLVQSGEVYTLSNDLLSATFSKVDGKLTFGGCEAMDLLPGDELFKIQVDNGTTVPASQMKLKEVTMETLSGDPKAAKGSLRIPGKALVAKYSYQKGNKNLDLEWRAVLRDGSHYLRSEIELTANQKTKMFSVIPMIYTVNNANNKKAPSVVGNTRGAVLMSDKIFAGLETPMGINTVKSVGSEEFNSFDAEKWTPQSFKWTPGDELPGEITARHVVAMRGYMKFYETGKNKITFQYVSGNNALHIVGVDALDLKGNLVAHDYHEGVAGDKSEKNSYTLDIPAADNYMVRYYVSKSEPLTSTGTISYDKKIVQAKVVYDGVAPKAVKTSAVSPLALSGNSIGENEQLKDNWTPDAWKPFEGTLPWRIGELGFNKNEIRIIEQDLTITSMGTLRVEFLYKSGSHRLNIAGVGLYDADGSEVAYDFHKGYTGGEKDKNIYTLYVPNTGKFRIRYYAETKTETITSDGNINLSLFFENIVHLPAPQLTGIEGKWSRNVHLDKGKTWNVSAVVGLIAEDQPRRSLLSYVERERAVPWRAYPIYNSWYELNINRNNDRNYEGNMHDYQCIDVVKQWQKNLYDVYGTGIKCFVWDDGWDIYGTWQFNQNFPNGFAEQDRLAREMEAGTGAWLGPVGGYGTSGNYRREYWSSRGGMQLSNPEYYKVFYKGCTDLMKKYDFRFFKFDGISGQFSSVGPDDGTRGEENAEGIIYAELDMRKVQPDIFFNTSVGTWASPFWFSITDAVWRQENDYGEIGNNKSDRERWITYRDRLVYQNFVQNSPMCPINCLMTHGFILTRFGSVSKNMDYDGIVREMRCAFACGSAMVELYCDYDLMNTIKDKQGHAGALWGELSKCIEWQQKNAEVLPDVHWVGGNPWTGNKHEVYGWGAWNGKHAMLALRNGANQSQTFKTTLRKALDIPAYVSGTITLNKGFEQPDLKGFAHGTAIDIDEELTLTLPSSSVYVFDNTVPKPVENYVVSELKQLNNRTAYTLQTAGKSMLVYNPEDKAYVQAAVKAPANTLDEQFAFVRHSAAPAGQYYLYAMGAGRFVTIEGSRLVLTAEPVTPVTVVPVAETDNQHFVLKFAGEKVVNLDKDQIRLEAAEVNANNSFVITAVNHKAGLSEPRTRVEDLYRYTRLDRKDWKVTATSWSKEDNGNGAVGKTIDDNIYSYWQSNVGNRGEGEQVMPYALTFNLGKAQKFRSFGCYARPDSEVGVVKNYVLEVSADQQSWKAVKAGELKFNGRKFLWEDFGKTVEAQYVRLTINSNQAGDAVAAIAEFYLGHDGSEVSPEMNNLPLFSTEADPQWYPVYFKTGGAYLEDKGTGQKLRTASKNAASEAQQWQFIGNEFGFVMKSRKGNYVCFHDDRFFSVSDRAKADELAFIQSGKFYLEIKVKGAANCMNQFGGSGVGKELGAWNPGDKNNVLQVMPVQIPDPELPTFSDDKQVTWYRIQFQRGKNAIESRDEGQSVRLAAFDASASGQEWKLVGNRNSFQIVGRDNLYLVVSDEPESETGNEAGRNDSPIRTSASKYGPGFKLVATKNMDFVPAWEIQSNDTRFGGKSFNQFAGAEAGRTIGLWTTGDGNNPLMFVESATGIGEVETEIGADEAVYHISGVRVDAGKQLPKGVYIVKGQKIWVK